MSGFAKITSILATIFCFAIAKAEVTGVETPTAPVAPPAAEEMQECVPGEMDDHSVAYRCVAGVFNNIVDLIHLPGNILSMVALGQERLNECNQSLDMKRGLMLIVEPLYREPIAYDELRCEQLMLMSQQMEDHAAREIMNKLRLQETLRQIMERRPAENDAQREVYDQQMANIALTPQEEQFWARKNARDDIRARAEQAALRRTWDNVRQQWRCADVNDVLTTACQVIADIGLGGVTAIGARAAARTTTAVIREATDAAVAAAERRLVGAADEVVDAARSPDAPYLETIDEGPSRDEIFDSLDRTGAAFNRAADNAGLGFDERGVLTSINPESSELARVLQRLQERYGIVAQSNATGTSRLINGFNTNTQQVHLMLDTEAILRQRDTIAQLLQLERRLEYSRSQGIFYDEGSNALVFTNPNQPMASRLRSFSEQTGLEVQTTGWGSQFVESGRNIHFDPNSGRLQIHPDLLMPGQERRLQRELDLVREMEITPFNSARETLMGQHGIGVDRNGNLTSPVPNTRLGQMIHRLQELGIRVKMDPREFSEGSGNEGAGGFAVGTNSISVRPEYFLPEHADYLLSLLNHEITHITTARRAIAGTLTPEASRLYSGRSIQFTGDDVDVFSGSVYNRRFQADEFDARVREANIGYRSGTQTSTAIRARNDAIQFATQQTNFIDRALASTGEWNIRLTGNSANVTIRVPYQGGHVSIDVPVYARGPLNESEARRLATLILQERRQLLEREAARLRQRAR